MRDSIPGMPTLFGAPKDNDDEFSVDLSEAPVGGGYLIPDGDYPAVLVDLRKDSARMEILGSGRSPHGRRARRQEFRCHGHHSVRPLEGRQNRRGSWLGQGRHDEKFTKAGPYSAVHH